MARKKFVQNDNNLAIAYYRFSSHSQNEASIDQQRELAREWADAHGMNIVKEYEDAAISGTTENRPGFQLMLSEVAKIRPSTLIMWKTDRLGRDTYLLKMAKRVIRNAGCEIYLLAENIPDDSPEGEFMEDIMDAYAAFYSRNMSQHIQRGMNYNAQRALYNGHKVFGYDVDRATKKYIVDPDTAPFAQRMFAEYAEGRAMQDICNDFNAQGVRTTRGAKFGVKTMNKMLQNRAYIGEYHHGDVVVADGMPALVDRVTFEKVQARFALNKRKGSQRAHGLDEDSAPRYWLTGKLFCGKCGESMQGVSGNGNGGRQKYRYYYCKGQRGKRCDKRKLRKEQVEGLVTMLLAYLLSDAITQSLMEREAQKKGLDEAIQAEMARAALFEDEHSIQAYFERFLHADMDNPKTRDAVMEYFVDKIYLYDNRLVAVLFYSEDRTEISWDEEGVFSIDPFVKGEAIEFDCFPFGSTK